MIYLKNVGRCGNQLFGYSFARKLQLLSNHDEIVVDNSAIIKERKKSRLGYWEDSLKRFSIQPYDKYTIEEEIENSPLLSRIRLKIWGGGLCLF